MQCLFDDKLLTWYLVHAHDKARSPKTVNKAIDAIEETKEVNNCCAPEQMLKSDSSEELLSLVEDEELIDTEIVMVILNMFNLSLHITNFGKSFDN